MKSKNIFAVGIALLVLGVMALPQTPNAAVNHFAKDGLSFDYPAGWQVSDQSSQQMQAIQIAHGDGYAELRVRVPREWLKTPEKEAHAKKIIQDKYVDDFIDSLQQSGLRPTKANASTEIAGAAADGVKVRALLDREPGGMDSYYRVVSDRFVNLSQLGSEKDMTKSAAAWDMIRTTIKIEPAPQSKPQASPSPMKPKP
jgi:hypothetical protein